MVSMSVDSVTIDFPIYQDSNRSLRKRLLAVSTGGLIQRSGERTVIRSLQDISFELKEGDRLGLIGRNGAGKTTLLRVLAQIYEPLVGSVKITGKVASMFDIGLGIDPEATGYENILIRSIFLDIPRKTIERKMDEIAEFTGLGDFLNMPVRTYSAGMSMRLAFAISTSIETDILLMDEWFMAGDSEFMKQAHTRLTTLVQQSGILVLASHSDAIIGEWCNKVLWLEHGKIRAFGKTEDVLPEYSASA